MGKAIKTIINEQLQPGMYEIDFNAAELASGTYFCKIEAGGFTDVKKMMLVK